MAEYYINGYFTNGTYKGEVYRIHCKENCLTPFGKFQIEIENLKLKLIGDARVDHDQIPIYNGKHYFYDTYLLSLPSLDSKKTFSIKFDTGVKIREIGNYEEINGRFDLWYKIEIDGVSGWVFGGLQLLGPTSK
jgi:hypothetical protein